MIDDVLTTGGTKTKLIDTVKASFPQVQFAGVVIAVDRQEKLINGETLSENFCKTSGMNVWTISNIRSISQALEIPMEKFNIS
jgi:orotate phosphoribosyltransferase